LSHQPIILIVIPVYNERETIRSVVTELINHSFKHIIIVDDGSDQDVFSELSDLPVYYIRHAVNLGQGAALQTGFDFSRQLCCDVVVTFDADGQHDYRDLPALAAPVVSGKADIVFGSRFIGAGKTRIPRTRKFILKCARFVNYLFTGIILTDAHNGLRAIHPHALNMIKLTENGMTHATEIMYEVKKLRLHYTEVSVNIRYTPYSRGKGQGNLNSIKIFSDLVLHKLFRSSSK
jgi:polyprenyl-phospho-N-acetylgalactosaminyl synthase